MTYHHATLLTIAEQQFDAKPTLTDREREWAFYQKLPQYLAPSELFVNNSLHYKALHDYLKPRSTFTESSYVRLKIPHTKMAAAQHLADLQGQFEALLQQTNEGLSAQKNVFINVVEDGKKAKMASTV